MVCHCIATKMGKAINPKVLLVCMLFTGAIFAFLFASSGFKSNAGLRTDNLAVDRFEDHFIAVNFCVKNEFPVFGFLCADSVYKFQRSKISEPYFALLKKQGPMTLFFRHPFYPFCMGIIYKTFGVKPAFEDLLAILLYSLVAGFLPFAGYQLLKKSGFFIGLGASFILLKYYPPYYHAPLQYFTAFWGFACFVAGLFLNEKNKPLHFAFGIICTAAFLAKGVYALIPLVYVVIVLLLAMRTKRKSFLLALSWFLLGTGLSFSPWFCYANYVNQKSE
jgi:hypothetical protein